MSRIDVKMFCLAMLLAPLAGAEPPPCTCRVYQSGEYYSAFYVPPGGASHSSAPRSYAGDALAECRQMGIEDGYCPGIKVDDHLYTYEQAIDLPSPAQLPAPDDGTPAIDKDTGYAVFKFHAPSGARVRFPPKDVAYDAGTIRTSPFEIGQTKSFAACVFWQDGGANHVCDEVSVQAGATQEWFVQSPFLKAPVFRVPGRAVMGHHPGVDWHAEKHAGQDFGSSNLQGAVLEGADLSRANLERANLVGIRASHAVLNKSFLGEADLQEADLRGADLREADLHGAKVARADLSDADLTGADLREVDLTRAKLDGAKLQGARISRGTILPAAILPDWHLAHRRGFVTPDAAHYPPPTPGLYDLRDTLGGLLCAHYRILPFEAKEDGDYRLTLACEGDRRGKLTTLHLTCNSLDQVCDPVQTGTIDRLDFLARDEGSTLTFIAGNQTSEAHFGVPAPPVPKPEPNPPPRPEPPPSKPPTPRHEPWPPGASPTRLESNVTGINGVPRPAGAIGYYFDGSTVYWYYGDDSSN